MTNEIIKKIEEYWKQIDINTKLQRKKIREYMKECDEKALKEIERDTALDLYYTKQELEDLMI